jgi:Zn-dependent protease/predicted transcriptional regulator
VTQRQVRGVRRWRISTTIPIFSIAGVAIRAHGTAIVAFIGLVLVLAAAYFPSVLPNEQDRTYWSVAFISTLFLFVSTIAHELAAALVARARGIAVNSITVVFFGGSSDIKRSEERPVDELLIAIAGPGASLLVALMLVGIRLALPQPSPPMMIFLESVILLNFWLAGFNLLPTLPLDGGRALRGLLWMRTGDYSRATRIASVVGQALAAALFLGGVILFTLSLDVSRNPVPTILGFDSRPVALVALVVAWFINNSARAAYRQVVLEGRFAGVTVEVVMTTEPGTVSPWTSLEEIVTHFFLQRGERAVAVVREGNVFMGIVAYSDVRKVARNTWTEKAAGEVMTPAGRVLSVSPQDGLDIAIRHMAERHLNQLPVLAEGKLVGMVTRANILRFLELDHPRR